MELLTQYGMFIAKLITLAVIFCGIIACIFKGDNGHKIGHIEVTNVTEQIHEMYDDVRCEIYNENELKEYKKAEKALAKAENGLLHKKNKIFLIDFHGDVYASEVKSLRASITAIIKFASQDDEVVVKIDSSGGAVHSYGLASSQLARIKDKGIPLTVCVDGIAASGGYMMACVADKIVAAPFAILGSIGVVSSLPNFNKLLKKNDIDYEIFTAGEYKRTVTMFGEITEKGRDKFKEDLEDTFILFKDFVLKQRPNVDIQNVATGETWYGLQAKDKNLIDEIKTSDEYLLDKIGSNEIFEVKYVVKKKLIDRFNKSIEAVVSNLAVKLLTFIQNKRYW